MVRAPTTISIPPVRERVQHGDGIMIDDEDDTDMDDEDMEDEEFQNERRVSFDEAMMDFFFENDESVSP